MFPLEQLAHELLRYGKKEEAEEVTQKEGTLTERSLKLARQSEQVQAELPHAAKRLVEGYPCADFQEK